MLNWQMTFGSPGRLAAATIVAALVVGLPIAVEMTGPGNTIQTSLSPAFASDGIRIAMPVPLSDRMPLLLESGLVIAGETAPPPGGRPSATVVIDRPSLLLDLSGTAVQARATPSAPDATASAMPQIAGFITSAMKLRRGQLAIVTPAGHRLTAEEVTGSVTVSRKGGYRFSGAGMMGGQRLVIDATWSEVVSREGPSQMPLRLTLSGALLEATLDGVFAMGHGSGATQGPSFVGQSEFRVPKLRRFLAWTGLGDFTGQQLSSLAVAGPLDWTRTQMSFARASVTFDDSQAAGALTIRHVDQRPKLDGTFALQDLDLDRYLTTRASPALPTAAGTTPALALFDADLRLSARSIRAAGLELGRAALTVSLDRGKLQADLADLELDGGQVGGQISVDVADPAAKTHMRIKARNMDVGRFLAAPIRRNALLGRANITFEGATGAETAVDAMSLMSGRGHIELAEPARLGLDLPALFHAARNARVVSWPAAGKGMTPLDSMSARFRLINGAVALESLVARSGGVAFAGSGRIDVPGRLLEVSLSKGATADAQPQTQNQSQGQSQIQNQAPDILMIRGTWEAPAISLDRGARSQFKAEAPVRPN